MVRLEAPPSTPPAAPARDPVAPWFLVVAASLLITALFPWERWCDPRGDIPTNLCFTAHVWSGSASLLGLGGLVLILLFLLISFRSGIRSTPGTARLTLFAAALSAVMAKTMIVQRNGTLSGDVGEFDPAGAVATTASLVALVGGVVLLLDLAFRWPRLRPFLGPIVVTASVTVVAVAYAASGLAWWEVRWPSRGSSEAGTGPSTA